MSFKYVMVEETNLEDFEKQLNYYGAKGFQVKRFYSNPNRFYSALMERFSNGRR